MNTTTKVLAAGLLAVATVAIGGSPHAAATNTCNGLPVTIHGTAGPDNLTGTNGPDVVSLLDGTDTITTGLGNDTICVGTGTKTINGGAGLLPAAPGSDTVVYLSHTAPITANLVTDTATGTNVSHTITNIENIIGGTAGDTLIGDDLGNRLEGRGGNDTVRPSGGTDTTIGGGGPRDRIDYSDSPAGVTVDLAAETGSGDGNDLVRQFEDITGSNFADHLSGNALANRIDGGSGGASPFTRIFGREGDDILTGSDSSNDRLVGGPGSDTLHGLGGEDALFAGNESANADSFPNTLNGGDGPDLLYSDLGDDILNGGPDLDRVLYGSSPNPVVVSLVVPTSAAGMGADTITGFERITGSEFGDSLTGNGLANHIDGLGGDDSINGLGSDDFLKGGVGADALNGGQGSDFCNGNGSSPPTPDPAPDTAVNCESITEVP